LESLDKAELVKLIHTLDKERTPSLKRGRTNAESPKTPGKARSVSQGEQSAAKKRKADTVTPDFGDKERSKIKAVLAKKALATIKKTGHSDKKKPYSEFSEGLPRSQALDFIGSLGTILSDSKKMQKRLLSGMEVEQLLGISEIHPVKFDGKTWCLAGERPFVYVWAKVDSLEIKIEESLMSLKFRTFMSGSGLPNAEGKCVSPEERMQSFLQTVSLR